MFYSSYGSSLMQGAAVMVVLLFIIAIVGGIVLHFTFLSDKNEGRYTGFLGKLYDFLSFRVLCIEGILRLFYVISVCVLCMTAIVVLFSGFVADGGFGRALISFILMVVLGNLLLRIAYELSLLSVLLVKNVIDINRKLGGGGTKAPSFEDMGSFSMAERQPEEEKFYSAPEEKPQEPQQESEPKAFCKNCGARFEREEAAFCTKCGHPR